MLNSSRGRRTLPSLKRIPRSSNNIGLSEQLKTFFIETVKKVPIGITPMEQLELKWSDEQDLNQIKYILQDLLQYPSTDLADLHRDSNKLGSFDIFQNQQLLTKMLQQQENPQIYCQCCGFLLQRAEVPLLTPLQNIGNMGISTLLYFQTLIYLAFMLIALFLIFGVFSLVTNVIAYKNFQDKDSILPNASYLIISLSPKQLNQTDQNMNFYFIQCWLGLVTIVVWFFMFLGIKYFDKNDQVLINNKTKSASDFSVVIQGVPTSMKKQDMQKQLDAYYSQLKQQQKPKQIDRPFNIAKYNVAVPFYLSIQQFIGNQLKIYINQKQKLKQKFISWINQRKEKTQFQECKTLRLQSYNNYRRLEDLIQLKYKDIVKRIVNQMKEKQNVNPTTSVYVTFDSSYARQLICHLNSPQDAIIKTKKKFECIKNDEYFAINFQNQKFLTNIKKAPQPEDIIWTNIGKSIKQMILRKMMTYTITALILGTSFVIFYFLSEQQTKNSNDFYLSFIISLSITIFNIVIQAIMRVLTNIQRQVTQTKYQTGLALKTIIAQLINSIVLTFVNIYKVDGLSYVIFTMGITISFLSPILKIFDIAYAISRISSWYYKKPQKKLYLTQSQLNQINTYLKFEVGFQYIYPVNLFLFICFFSSLQPIICVFGILGLLAMYLIQKYTLLNRCRRPYPGNDLINRAIYRIIYLGPLIFSLGNITWSNLLPGGQPERALIPNLICIGISTVFALVPNKAFFQKFLEQKYEPQMFYSNERIYFSSEYQRLNPATAKKAMVDYYHFLKQFKQKLKQNTTNKQLMAIGQMMMSQKQRLDSTNHSSILQSLFSLNFQTLQKVSKVKYTEQNEQEQYEKIQNQILKQEQQQVERLSAQSNQIGITEQGIEQLKLTKKQKQKKSLNSFQLFKQMFNIDKSNKYQFVQNWITEQNTIPIDQKSNNKFQSSIIGQLLNKNNEKQINNEHKNSQNEFKQQNIPNLKQKKVQNNQNNQFKRRPKLRMEKFVENVKRKEITYQILRDLLKKHDSNNKNQKSQRMKRNQAEKNKIDKKQKQPIQSKQQSSKNKLGLFDMILNSGKIIPANDNQDSK